MEHTTKPESQTSHDALKSGVAGGIAEHLGAGQKDRAMLGNASMGKHGHKAGKEGFKHKEKMSDRK